MIIFSTLPTMKNLSFGVLFSVLCAVPVMAQNRPGDLPCHINDRGIIIDMTYICGVKPTNNVLTQNGIMREYAQNLAKLNEITDPFERAVKEAEAEALMASGLDLFYVQNGMPLTGEGEAKNKIHRCLRDFQKEGASLATAKSSCGAY